ncbi:reverse transcriptase domain-containing protein [Tanacetum coccineum]
MIPSTAPLIGFSREIIWSIGQISLSVKMGDTEHSTSTRMDFVVVRSPSPYNGIIGRPGVRKTQTVPLTAHRMLKFPVLGGILTLRSSKLIPLECMMVSGPELQPSASTRVAEERIKMAIHPKYPEKTIAIGSTLTEEGRKELCGLLRRNLDIFSWKPSDMTGVPRHVAEHRLNVREGCSPARQKKRSQASERNKAIQGEVKRLVEVGIIKEVHYHSWFSNLVMVKKHDHSWRMCVDFKVLNKACPKYGYPLLEIDWKVKQIGRNLEVYVDDLVIKSRTEQEIIRDIKETFKTLREINMKLNPKKCTFGVEEGMFLGYMVNTKGIKVCPEKVEVVLKCLKDVQRLNGKLASLNRFLSKSAEKSLSFFKTLKKCTKKSDFQWTTKAEAAFKQMKKLITVLPTLTAHMEKEELIVYLAATREAVKTLPGEKKKARSVQFKSRRYAVINGILYKKSFFEPWLRWFGPLQANYVMREIYEVSCSMHAGPRSMVAKAIRTRNPQQMLTPITSPWLFYKWGIDIAGPFPEGPDNVKFLIVAMDYFTKWIKAKPVATITGNQIKKFVWDNIVCKFGLPGEIISDNGKQFRDNPFKDWCEKLNIRQRFASVKHSQTNGLVERANRSLGEGMKARLDKGSKD